MTAAAQTGAPAAARAAVRAVQGALRAEPGAAQDHRPTADPLAGQRAPAAHPPGRAPMIQPVGAPAGPQGDLLDLPAATQLALLHLPARAAALVQPGAQLARVAGRRVARAVPQALQALATAGRPVDSRVPPAVTGQVPSPHPVATARRAQAVSREVRLVPVARPAQRAAPPDKRAHPDKGAIPAQPLLEP